MLLTKFFVKFGAKKFIFCLVKDTTGSTELGLWEWAGANRTLVLASFSSARLSLFSHHWAPTCLINSSQNFYWIIIYTWWPKTVRLRFSKLRNCQRILCECCGSHRVKLLLRILLRLNNFLSPKFWSKFGFLIGFLNFHRVFYA